MKRLWPFALLVVIGGLLFWGLQRGDPTRLPSVLIGKPAPTFELATLPPYRSEWGERFRLSEHLGQKPVVINIWASWCVPACYNEAPVLESAYRKYKGRVLFVGLNNQDTEEAALRFIRQFDLSFPNVFDPRGTVGVDYGMYGVPETFVIDREGKVVYRHAGEIDAAKLEELIQRVL